MIPHLNVCLSLCLVLLCFSLNTQARQITFINSCGFPISVSGNGQVVTGILSTSATSKWTIPSAGWSGRFYRTNAYGGISGYPSATLAEFNFAAACTTNCQWNYDWFDISIIPPGCSGSSGSYQACVTGTNPAGVSTNDGYDVGMEMVPLACPQQSRICTGKGCPGAYGFPDDNSKTTACTQLGDWQVTFCPAGSYVDLFGAQLTVPDATVAGGPPGFSSMGAALGIGIGIGVVFVLVIVGVVLLVRKNRS